MDSCKISVIMPVFNSGKYLETAINSVLSQTLNEIELFLIDDGSIDGSSELCDNFALKDKRVKVIHQKNAGICKARNVALNMTHGEYIAFIDHDDEYLLDFLEKAYKVAQEVNADIVKLSKKEIIFREQVVVRERYYQLNSQILEKKDIKRNFFSLLENGVFTCVWDGIYKKEIVLNNGVRFDEFFKNGGEDIDFMMQIVKYVELLVTVPDICYLHYIRKGFSTSAKFKIQKVDHLKELPKRVNSTLDYLDLHISQYEDAYSYYLVKEYISPIVALYANPRCNFDYLEKKRMIEKVRNAHYMIPGFFRRKTCLIFKKSIKMGTVYFLFKYKMYRLLLLVFSLRSKYV